VNLISASKGGWKNLDAPVRLFEDISRRFEKKTKMASDEGLELEFIRFMQEI